MDTETGSITFVAWPDTKLFHNLVKNIESAREYVDDAAATIGDEGEMPAPFALKVVEKPVLYRGKVKLHGSNAGVALEGTQLRAQSRTQFIDKSGFGRIVFEKNEQYWKSLIGEFPKVTVYGEYCGPKVQSGVALSKLKQDIFAVFAIDISKDLIVDPELIERFMTKNGSLQLPTDVFVLPWHTDPIPIDIGAQSTEAIEARQKSLDHIETHVESIDSNDPWVKTIFDIDGPGEGLVMYPVSLEFENPIVGMATLPRSCFSLFAFKAKGEKHRVVAAKKSVSVAPEVAANAQAYADLMLPEPRLEQGAGEVGGFEMSKLKAFIAWIVKDVQKEGQDELAASKLTWENVAGVVTKKASAWYAKKTNALKKRN